MKMMPKYPRYVLTALVLLNLLIAYNVPAHAARIYNWDFDDGTTRPEYKNVSLSNLVSLTVTVSGDTGEVLINGEKARWSSRRYEECTADVTLKPGINDIEIIAVDEDDSEDNDTETITIHYIQDDIPGSKYFINDLSETGTDLELFGGAFNLELPDQHMIMFGDSPAYNQQASVEVARANLKPAANITYASNIFSFKGASNAYSVGPNSTLTLQYNPKISNTEAGMLTIMRMLPAFPPQLGILPNGAQNLGGTVNTSSKTISTTIPDNAFGYYAVVKMTGDFKDFYQQGTTPSPVSWSRPYILTLWAKGVMSPLQFYADGTRVPEGFFGLLKPGSKPREIPITRKELASMLVKALRLPKEPLASLRPTYGDLSGLSVTERIDIETATQSGLFSGFPGEGTMEFRPGAEVTRQQAAVIFARAANVTLPDTRQAEAVLKNFFKDDYQQIDQWAYPYILSALKQRLVNVQEPGRFNPDIPVSRAEAARTVYFLMQKNGFL